VFTKYKLHCKNTLFFVPNMGFYVKIIPSFSNLILPGGIMRPKSIKTLSAILIVLVLSTLSCEFSFDLGVSRTPQLHLKSSRSPLHQLTRLFRSLRSPLKLLLFLLRPFLLPLFHPQTLPLLPSQLNRQCLPMSLLRSRSPTTPRNSILCRITGISRFLWVTKKNRYLR